MTTRSLNGGSPSSDAAAIQGGQPRGGAAPRDRVAIEASGVGKRFIVSRDVSVEALRDISFRLHEGQFMSLVGPSGCGKSTLIQILAGLMKSSTGDVYLDGQKLIAPSPDKISIVFQDATLLPWKSALANVEFPLAIQGVARAERRARAERYLELVGLADFRLRMPHELSGGMRQRASIARALAQEPRVILMDEPFGALDEQTRIKMGNELLRIWEATRKTVLLITHSLTEAIYLSDVVQVMAAHPGRIIERIDIDLPRPRGPDIIGSESFGTLRNRLWQLIANEESEGTDSPGL